MFSLVLSMFNCPRVTSGGAHIAIPLPLLLHWFFWSFLWRKKLLWSCQSLRERFLGERHEEEIPFCTQTKQQQFFHGSQGVRFRVKHFRGMFLLEFIAVPIFVAVCANERAISSSTGWRPCSWSRLRLYAYIALHCAGLAMFGQKRQSLNKHASPCR